MIGESSYNDGNDNLTTIGEDQPPLQSAAGYDDVTGLGAPTTSFVTAFPRAARRESYIFSGSRSSGSGDLPELR